MEVKLMARFERRGGFRGGGRSFGGGGRSFDRGYDVPKPIKEGEEYDIEINEVGSKGDGIARIKNFVVFVTGAKQGEKCRVKIKEVRNRFAFAEKVGEGTPSTETAETDKSEATDATEEEVAEAEETSDTEETEEETAEDAEEE
jgi:predicted RNA-binding protein with TRAM domain